MRRRSQRQVVKVVRCPFAGAKPAPEERNPEERAHIPSAGKNEEGQGDTATCEKWREHRVLSSILALLIYQMLSGGSKEVLNN